MVYQSCICLGNGAIIEVASIRTQFIVNNTFHAVFYGVVYGTIKLRLYCN